MRRSVILVALLALPFAVRAADPYVGYVYPAAVAAGTTNRLVVGGQFFWQKLGAWVSGEGVRVLGVECVPGFPYADNAQRRYLQDWLEAIERGETSAPPLPELKPTDAWRTNRWWKALDTLDAKSRAIVAKDLWVRRNALQDAPSLRQLALVTVAVDPDAAPGLRQLRVFRDDAFSAPRPLEILPMPVVEEPLYRPPKRARKAPPAIETLPQAVVGQILPGETDRWRLRLKGGERFTAVVRGRAYQPYVGDAVPGFFNPVVTLKTADGREVAFADDFNRMEPDPRLSVVVPATGDYVFEIADRLFRGREDFVYTAVFTHEALPTPAAGVALPLVRDFEVDAPGERVFEVKARRLGSPMDARIELFDADGRTLAAWDDVTNAFHVGTVIQDELDPIGRHRFEKPGRYRVRVDDTCGRRGPGMRCELEIRPPAPSFELVASRSGFRLAKGQRQDFTVRVSRREGFAGPIALAENDCVRFENALIPSGADEWTVTAVGKLNEPGGEVRNFDVVAVGRMPDGRLVTGTVVAADAYEQAFAWNHLVSYGRFVFACRHQPPKKEAAPTAATKKARPRRGDL